MTDLFEHADSRALQIKVIEGEPRIRDLDLAARLGFDDQHMIRRLITRHEAALSALGVSVTVTETAGSKGGRPGTATYLNRKQSLLIVMKSETVTATEIAIEVIERFDAYEKGTKSPFPVPTNMIEALQLALDQAKEIERQRVVIADAQPKVESFDLFLETKGGRGVQQAAKQLHYPQNKLVAFMLAKRWLFRSGSRRRLQAMADQVLAGNLDVVSYRILPTDGSDPITRENVLITNKGLHELSRLLGRDALLPKTIESPHIGAKQ